MALPQLETIDLGNGQVISYRDAGAGEERGLHDGQNRMRSTCKVSSSIVEVSDFEFRKVSTTLSKMLTLLRVCGMKKRFTYPFKMCFQLVKVASTRMKAGCC